MFTHQNQSAPVFFLLRVHLQPSPSLKMALIIATAFGAMPLVAHALVYNEDTNYQAPVAAYGPGPNQTYASSSARPAAWNYVYQDPSTQTDLSPGYIFCE